MTLKEYLKEWDEEYLNKDIAEKTKEKEKDEKMAIAEITSCLESINAIKEKFKNTRMPLKYEYQIQKINEKIKDIQQRFPHLKIAK